MSKKSYTMQGLASKQELDVFHLIFAPTFACNLKCKHCYLPNRHAEHLPIDTAMKLVDDWAKIVLKEKGKYNGIFHIKGGEPFVVPYFWELVDKVVATQSLLLMLTTNGTFCDEETIAKLIHVNEKLDKNMSIIVSLDGATDETNAKLRGEGNFEKTLKFMKKIADAGIYFFINCVLHKGNLAEISQFIELAKSYNATQVNFLNFVPHENSVNIKDWQETQLAIYEAMANVYLNGDNQTKRMLTGSLPEIITKEKDGSIAISDECVAAYRGLLYVLPNGNVCTCPNVTFAESVLGNIKANSLPEIFENIKKLHDGLKLFSGQFLCSGERKLYIDTKDNIRLANLKILQETLAKSLQSNEQEKFSYCFNRNW